MNGREDAVVTIRDQLMPLLGALDEQLEEDGGGDEQAFFRHIRAMLDASREVDDLAGPFMELSTAAFRGFRLGPVAALLVDEVLGLAQQAALTLSAPGESEH